MMIHEYEPGHFDWDIITQKIRKMIDYKPCRCFERSAEENSQIIGLNAILTCSGIPIETPASYREGGR
jgi:hypothetical protein